MLIEVAAAALVLTVAVCGMSGSIVSAMAIQRVNRETALGREAAQRAMERIRGVTFAEAFARFNSDPSDDPGGPGTAPGSGFEIPGLDAVAGDVDGLAGEFLFPTVTVGGVRQLREDVVDPGLGMPSDLDGVGGIDSLDHATDYRLLPVRVRVRWQGVNGRRSLSVETVLSAR